MNEHDNEAIESLASAWTVTTTDISQRVKAAIGANRNPTSEASLLLDEIRAIRREMEGFRQANANLHDEILRLRLELKGRSAIRIAPYSPAEGLVRLS